MGDNKKDKIGILKFWSWQSRGISMGCYVIILGYLTIYCTDTLMIAPATVGTLLLVSKIFDGITDLIAGYLIDNTHTKLGKARPYEFCFVGLWLCTWLLYTASANWSDIVKCIWIFVMYTFVNSIFATFLNANQTPYLLRAFPTQNQMIKVNAFGGIVVTLGCAVVAMLLPGLTANLNTTAGWSKLIGILAIPLFVLGMLRFLFVKETVDIREDTTEKVSFSDMGEVLKNNKYIYFVAGISAIYNLILGLNAYTYYFKYVGGGIDRYTLLAAISMPLLIVMFIFPKIMEKGVTVAKIISFGGILGFIGYCMNFFAGDNMVILVIAAVLYTFAGLPIAYLSGLMILDCAEYNTLTGHKRLETTIAALSSFATKVGNGLGIAALGFILALFGYDGALETQSASAIFGIKAVYSFLPGIMYLIIAILAATYKLDKELPALREKAK